MSSATKIKHLFIHFHKTAFFIHVHRLKISRMIKKSICITQNKKQSQVRYIHLGKFDMCDNVVNYCAILVQWGIFYVLF
jgi:hypothetical protein